MDDFFVRLFTIIIGTAVSLFFLLYSATTLCTFFTIVGVVCLYEFHISIGDLVGKLYSGLISASIYSILIAYAFESVETRYVITIFPLTLSLFGFEILAKEKFSFRNVGLGIICIVWIVIPLALCTFLAMHDGFEPRLIIGILLVVWLNDAGAYCVGRMGGATPLHPKLSPKKTWEGSIGGAIVAGIVGYIVSCYFTFLRGENWLYISAICIFCGSVGDLIESMFKRSLDIKDTGKLLPGHGGLLDRFDAVLYSVPFVFTYLVLAGLIN